MQSSLKTILRGLTFFCLTWTIAITGYWWAGWGILDAVYMTTITIFGVGYGEVRPMEDPRLRVFTMFVIVAGCSSTAYVIGGFVQMLAEGQINRVLGARRMTKGIGQLTNHTLLCGYGRVGQQLAKELQAANQRFVIIDSDLDRLREAELAGYLVLVGDCTEESVLRTGGIDRASAVASVLSDDAANVFLTLTARELNPTVRIIARAESPSTEKKLHRSGANCVVLPTAIGATKIANLISRPAAENLMMDEAGRQRLDEQLAMIGLKIQEVAVAATSSLVGQLLSKVEGSGRGGFVVIGIQRGTRTLNRTLGEDLEVETGDTILLVGHTDQLEMITLRAGQRTEQSYRGRKI